MFKSEEKSSVARVLRPVGEVPAVGADAAKAEAAKAVTFASLNLAGPLLKAVSEDGYEIPTPIQAKAIPPIMLGRDVLGCAQTGTGKTAAFALPIIHRLITAPVDKTRRGPVLPKVLILSPTRELATQIVESFATYGRHTMLAYTVVYGGVSQFHQVRALKKGVDVLVATPGRLIDLLDQRVVCLDEVSTLVLDESDRMLDMGFIQPIRRIVSSLKVKPDVRQTLMFSATMPREIMHLADSLLRDPVKVAVTPVASAAPMIEQSVFFVPRMQKPALLEYLLQNEKIERAIVFMRTKHGADKLMHRLERAQITAEAIHGNKAQNQRQRALHAFRTGRSRVLVATDVAARGLDVDGITHVFNYDMPVDAESYVHRIGRTGRAGAKGLAYAFCDPEERGLLRDIERLTGKRVPVVDKLPVLPKESAMGRAPVHFGEDAPQRPTNNGGYNEFTNDRVPRSFVNSRGGTPGRGVPSRNESGMGQIQHRPQDHSQHPSDGGHKAAFHHGNREQVAGARPMSGARPTSGGRDGDRPARSGSGGGFGAGKPSGGGFGHSRGGFNGSKRPGSFSRSGNGGSGRGPSRGGR